MRYWPFLFLFVFSCYFSSASCHNTPGREGSTFHQPHADTTSSRMKIIIGSTVFTASLYDNATANAFKALLPLVIDMEELNNNEKFFYLPDSLPAKATSVKSIQEGDLMLYGSNCLVLFYASFNTPYTYTTIGRIDNPSGLAKALGKGKVLVRLE